MAQFSHLLRKAAGEVREHCQAHPDARDTEWMLSFAQRLEAASFLESDAEIEEAIDALAYSKVDSGPPLTMEFAPSFDHALDALQRRRRRDARR